MQDIFYRAYKFIIDVRVRVLMLNYDNMDNMGNQQTTNPSISIR